MMWRNLPYLAIILTFFVSCKKVGSFLSSYPERKPFEPTSVDTLKDGDRPSDSSGGVPGYLVPSCSAGFSLDGPGSESRCLLSGDPVGYASVATELPQDSRHPLYRFTGLNRENILDSTRQLRYSLKLQLGAEPGFEEKGKLESTAEWE